MFETHPKEEARRVVPVVRKTLVMLLPLTLHTFFVVCTTAPLSTPDTDPVASVALVHIPSSAVPKEEQKRARIKNDQGGVTEQMIEHAVWTVRLPNDGAALEMGLNYWHWRIGLSLQAAASPATLFGCARRTSAHRRFQNTGCLEAALGGGHTGDICPPRRRHLGADAAEHAQLRCVHPCIYIIRYGNGDGTIFGAFVTVSAATARLRGCAVARSTW